MERAARDGAVYVTKTMGGVYMKRSMLITFLSVFLVFGLVTSGHSQSNAAETENTEVSDLFQKVKNNAPTSERISALEEIAMHYYWHGGDLKKAEEEIFKGITLHGNYDVVQEAFKQAATIDPYDLDLKYSLASAQILQKNIEAALATYKEILNFDPSHFEARLMHGVYSKVLGDDTAFKEDMKALKKLDKERADAYTDKIKTVENVKTVKLNTDIPENLPDKEHAFVVLGYALSDEGKMRETLLNRLQVAKKAALRYPHSKIIVTGGVPKNGVTEADVMFDWLVANGIDEKRIIKEAMATDTVENAIFSMEIVKNEQIKDVTLITSATHMRRALVVFQEINAMMANKNDPNTDRILTQIVEQDFKSEEEMMKVSQNEELVIFRDLARATGIWQFPGLQR